MLRQTPLRAAHERLGARLVEFGGWEMPVQYTGIVDEHLAVRNAAGIFDISHMGEVFVRGHLGLQFLNATLTNDARKCPVGRGQYTLMCQPAGGVVDDLYAYHVEPDVWLLIVNASRIDADVAWLRQQLAAFPGNKDVALIDASEQHGAVAIQGPKVAQFIDRAFTGPSVGGTAAARPTELQKNELAAFSFRGTTVWVARTGYTGEDGFEVITPAALIETVWNAALELGAPHGLKPCGLGARDTLRTEMCYPLYGHELDEQTTPLEAGLGSFVALDKGEFCGRSVLAAQKAAGVKKRCVAFRMTSKSAPPRPQYPIWTETGDKQLGQVVSGTQSPSLGVGIGLGYVAPEFAKAGTALQIEIRGKKAPAEIVSKPIYRKPV
ncbi:MAG: glycine cleavage system aminomethyltransferase GcvT [Verrucomicrobiota bacterium]